MKDAKINHLLEDIIGLVEMVFSERVRAYYLTGSYAEGTAVSHSDLDLIGFLRYQRQIRGQSKTKTPPPTHPKKTKFENLILKRCKIGANHLEN